VWKLFVEICDFHKNGYYPLSKPSTQYEFQKTAPFIIDY